MVGNSCGPTDHPNDDIGQAILRLSRSRNEVKKMQYLQAIFASILLQTPGTLNTGSDHAMRTAEHDM